MEWVEKAAKTVDEAKEQALEQLGVTERDAEIVVVAEPRAGLFGRVRGEARVRARVRPAEPPPKRPRRQRERGRASASGARGPKGRGPGDGSGGRDATDGSAGSGNGERSGAAGTRAPGRDGGGSGTGSARRRRRRGGGGGGGAGQERQDGPAARPQDRPAGGVAAESGRNGAPRRAHREESTQEEGTVAEGVTLAEQGEAAKEFLSGLLDRFGLEAMLEVRELDEQTVEIAADGEGLGMLVGPKGATLASIQDVTRTVVQRQFPHRTDRILVDVARYRERRAAALRRFAEDVAAEVRTSGAERALEPMSPPDRKVVHDTVVGLEGVSSSSRGEEPSRYVVISPEHAELAEPEGTPQD